MLKKRIAVALVIVFVLGVVFCISMSEYDTYTFRALFIGVFIVSAAFMYLSRFYDFKYYKQIFAAALMVAAFSLGVLRVSLANADSESARIYENKSDTVVLELIEYNESSMDVRVVESSLGVSRNTKLRLYSSSFERDMIAGDVIKANVRYRSNSEISLLSKDIDLTATGSITERLDGEGFLYDLRSGISESAEWMYEPFTYADGISKSVVNGDRSDIDTYMYSVFKATGITHILSISGMHISLIVMCLNTLLIGIGFYRRQVNLICIVFTLIYTALVGFTPGVVRSAIMMIVVLIAQLFLRQVDRITILFYSLLILVLENPYSICSIGLQLSFLCTLGILLADGFGFRFREISFKLRGDKSRLKKFAFRIYRTLFMTVAVTFVAAVFSFPVLFGAFDTVSWISPIANLILVPIFSIGIEIAFFASLIAFAWPWLAGVIAYPAGWIFDAVTEVSIWVYDKDLGSISSHLPLLIIPLLISLAIIGIFIFVSDSRRRSKAIALTVCAFCASIVFCEIYYSYAWKDRVFIEYGNGRSEYIYSGSDGGTYIDFGGYTSASDAVFEGGYTKLENYVMLDYDPYSVARFSDMSGKLPISKLHLPTPENDFENSILLQIKALSEGRNCVIILYNDAYVGPSSDTVSVSVYGVGDDPAVGTFVCVDIGEHSIRFVDSGYTFDINAETVIALDGFDGQMGEIRCDRIFVPDGCAYADAVTYRNNIRLVADNPESEFDIYEP